MHAGREPRTIDPSDRPDLVSIADGFRGAEVFCGDGGEEEEQKQQTRHRILASCWKLARHCAAQGMHEHFP